ncbi:MAG: aminoacyl-tRNA hydrolase [Candidatus Marinimicrobia bacterium]|nr:aminoacyl-tRNA hydrolase [Candidatus Neomarinimicrobiota bacterium]
MFFFRKRQHEDTETTQPKIIVGLGNPGMKYTKNRHNFGFMVVDRLAEQRQIRFSPAKSSFVFADSRKSPASSSTSFRLCKPMTFMNASGVAVKQMLKYFDAESAQIFVVYDDIDLPLGALRIRPNGSAGGHRGMKSIIDQIGTDEFPRLRLGIGPQGNLASEDFVLTNFRKEEWPIVNDVIETSVNAVNDYAEHDIYWIMNKYNQTKHKEFDE